MTQPSQPNNQSTTTNPVGRFMVAAGAVIVHEQTGKILVIQRASDQDWHPNEWEIDYGRIDQFETPEEGLRRELFEEVGLKELNNIQLLRAWHIFRGPETAENEVVGITYTCSTPTSEITLSHEHQAYKWVTPEEALELIKVDGIRLDIQLYQQQRAKQSMKVGKDVIGVGAGALIFNADGKLLLAKRGAKAKNERGMWEIPGGAVEFGETIAQALKREIKEELAIEIEVNELLQLCDHIIPDEHQHWVSPTYICKIISGTPTIQEPEKCEALGWYTVEETVNMQLSSITKRDIEVLQTQTKQS